ncbi:MAG: hypothetical protein PHW93_04100 [Candidatus Methanomethylophilaceae archaeon]|nr:hypothetical protein [Candidatus Methanomethylophilaceae archaeon]
MVDFTVAPGYTESDLEHIRAKMWIRSMIPSATILFTPILFSLAIFDVIPFDTFTLGIVFLTILELVLINFANTKNRETLSALERDGVYLPFGRMPAEGTTVAMHNRRIQRFLLLYMVPSVVVHWMVWFIGSTLI